MDDLDGRVAIVTGASRGIGRQIALELSRRGMTVVVAARTVDPHRRLPGTIGDTVAAIEAAGGTALAVRTDVTVVEDLEQLVATAAAEFGRIDVLVNNAAETNSSRAPIDEMPRADWLHEFDANVHAPFTLIGAVLPHLRRQGGGLIVNVTSGAGDLDAVRSERRHAGGHVARVRDYESRLEPHGERAGPRAAAGRRRDR